MSNKVSIIMGVYNCACYLNEAIDSIIAQSYKNWELIICDDASTDSTLKILQEYKIRLKEKLIILNNNENLGLNKTLNKCLKKATGCYIARMDGDDISLLNRLEQEVQFLDSNPQYDIVSCPMIYFDNNGNFKTGSAVNAANLNNFAKGTPFCHAPCMVRKKAFNAVNGYSTHKNTERVEDWDLWIRMYENGFKGFNLNIPLYKMRDDRNAYKRRKYKYRINEFRTSLSATNKLKLNKINFIYSLRPLIVGLLPKPLYLYLHKNKRK